MNKYIILLLALITMLSTNLSALSMFDRIQGMELEMKKMQEEIVTLKTSEADDEESDDEDADEESSESDDEDADEEESDDEDADEEESDDEDADEEESDDEESLFGDDMTIEERLEEAEETINELNIRTNGNKLKLGVDYRFALDNMQYTMADGSTQGNDAFMTNRLWINMNWKATDNLSFSGQLAYNKAFGARSGWNSNMAGMETFDWITNENAYDDVVRVRTAYFLYKNDTFAGIDTPWTFSIGRRPSTNGHLINLRDDDGKASPMAHTINVEFDGASAKFGLEELTGINGMYVKFCAGLGGTNASPKFFAVNPKTGSPEPSRAPYSTNPDDIPNIHLFGFIFTPYDNGQYALATQYYYAENLIDADVNASGTMLGMKTVGGMHSVTANFTVNGIGDEWSDYLDDTFFFVSGAMSVSNPKDGVVGGMFGSEEAKTGHSVWVGLQMPSVMTGDGRWGIEYNQGSKYWRSITYAEDTNIGSKIAARGEAYEIYFTEPLVEDILTFQVRATYIDYKYSGSNGFFGNITGTPVKIANSMPTPMGNIESTTVDTAQDIRFYLRYRF